MGCISGCILGFGGVLYFVWGTSDRNTKNTTTIVKIVNYYAVVFLLRAPNLLRRRPFFERENVCNSQENGVRARCAAIVNHPAVLKILRVVNLLRVLFLVRRGSFGQEATKDHFDMTTLIFSTGGCPSYPFCSFKRGPWYPVFRENPSSEVATKDHSSSNPAKGNPQDLKTKVDVSKVDVKGFPTL